MRIVPVTPPASEPVTLADAQLHLRLETADDEALVTALVTAAREWVERRAHVALITQTYDLFLDAWDNHPWRSLAGYVGWSTMSGTTVYNDGWRTNQIDLPIGPIQSVSFVKFTDMGQDVQTWDPSNYGVSAGFPGRLFPLQNVVFPVVAAQADAIQVRVVAGYGGAQADVPQRAQAAIKLILTWLYANRQPTALELSAVDALVNSLGCGKNLFA